MGEGMEPPLREERRAGDWRVARRRGRRDCRRGRRTATMRRGPARRRGAAKGEGTPLYTATTSHGTRELNVYTRPTCGQGPRTSRPTKGPRSTGLASNTRATPCVGPKGHKPPEKQLRRALHGGQGPQTSLITHTPRPGGDQRPQASRTTRVARPEQWQGPQNPQTTHAPRPGWGPRATAFPTHTRATP